MKQYPKVEDRRKKIPFGAPIHVVIPAIWILYAKWSAHIFYIKNRIEKQEKKSMEDLTPL